jgi:hypothetical protein
MHIFFLVSHFYPPLMSSFSHRPFSKLIFLTSLHVGGTQQAASVELFDSGLFVPRKAAVDRAAAAVQVHRIHVGRNLRIRLQRKREEEQEYILVYSFCSKERIFSNLLSLFVFEFARVCVCYTFCCGTCRCYFPTST